jgi:hypothetical protein
MRAQFVSLTNLSSGGQFSLPFHSAPPEPAVSITPEIEEMLALSCAVPSASVAARIKALSQSSVIAYTRFPHASSEKGHPVRDGPFDFAILPVT